MDKETQISVFVSYESESVSLAISLVQYLRECGFDALCDSYLLDDGTSVSISTMEVTGMQSNKVIFLLSEKYKEKADGQYGGVWQEYRRYLKERDEERYKNKYIFVVPVSHSLITKDYLNRVLPEGEDPEVVSLFSKMDLLRKILGQSRYEFNDVSKNIPVIHPDTIPSLDEVLRSHNRKYALDGDLFGFENIFINTKYTIYDDDNLEYEVTRLIRVTAPRLQEFVIKPVLICDSDVLITSPFFDTKILRPNVDKMLSFNYPIPSDNNEGDLIIIKYRLNFRYSGCNNQEKGVCFFKCENKSKYEIHEIVMPYKTNNPDAILNKRSFEIGTKGYGKVESLPFNKNTQSYVFELINPGIGTIYDLKFDV